MARMFALQEAQREPDRYSRSLQPAVRLDQPRTALLAVVVPDGHEAAASWADLRHVEATAAQAGAQAQVKAPTPAPAGPTK